MATLEVDLDAQGRFASGLIALTNSRLLAFEPAGATWRDFPLAEGQHLKLSDHGGLAFLELFDATRRLARWRFTLACNPAAVRFVELFEREQQRRAGEPVRQDEEEAEDFDFGESSAPPSTCRKSSSRSGAMNTRACCTPWRRAVSFRCDSSRGSQRPSTTSWCPSAASPDCAKPSMAVATSLCMFTMPGTTTGRGPVATVRQAGHVRDSLSGRPTDRRAP